MGSIGVDEEIYLYQNSQPQNQGLFVAATDINESRQFVGAQCSRTGPYRELVSTNGTVTNLSFPGRQPGERGPRPLTTAATRFRPHRPPGTSLTGAPPLLDMEPSGDDIANFFSVRLASVFDLDRASYSHGANTQQSLIVDGDWGLATISLRMASALVATLPEKSLLAQIGNTPLLELSRLVADLAGISLFAKAEYFNPGGSVKDRPALHMLQRGEEEGLLRPGKIILDSTSGNTGIAYAMIGAAKGYPVKLCLPENASPERKRILKAYGAEVITTPGGEGSDGAIRRCREIYSEAPERYFYPDQYNNPANWQSHFLSTGVEIMQQTEGQITHFIAGLGTSGTFVGVTRRFRQDMPHVVCISVQPSSSFHGLEGMKHMPTAIVPGIYDESLADENLGIETEDAHRMVRRVAREEGVLIGVSAGANLVASRQVAERLAAEGRTATLVTVLCDSADKYLSEHFWDDHD